LGSSFLVPFIYPNVGKEVLHFTFWGLIIAACVQPAKVLIAFLEMVYYLVGETLSTSCLAM
jgi:hypothetical protein